MPSARIDVVAMVHLAHLYALTKGTAHEYKPIRRLASRGYIALGSIAAQAQAIKPPDALDQGGLVRRRPRYREGWSGTSIRAGDVQKVIALVDSKVMPYVDFQRMTASAVGRYWKQATREQQKRLQDEFRRSFSCARIRVRWRE